MMSQKKKVIKNLNLYKTNKEIISRWVVQSVFICYLFSYLASKLTS